MRTSGYVYPSPRRWPCPRYLFTLMFLALLLGSELAWAQTNVTMDDTDLFITYSPTTAWHASTVSCDTCLMPLNSTAHGGTWHDGSHVIPTTDEDDEGTVGDSDGDGTTSAPASASSTSASSSTASPPPSTSSSSPTSTPTSASSTAAPAQSTATDNDDNDDNDNDDGDDDSDKGGKGGGGKGNKRSIL